MNQLDARRQDLVDAVADDRVRLPAADLHDGPRPRRDAVDVLGDPLRDLAVAKLVEVLHGGRRLPELLLQHPHLAEWLERLQRGGLVEARDREADVHHGVVADGELRQVRQAHVLDDAAEVDLPHADSAGLVDRQHLPGNR